MRLPRIPRRRWTSWVQEATDPATSDVVASAREAMVAAQLRRRGIADERVLAAMGSLPRERFVDPGMQAHAYDDAPLPIEFGQAISQPYMVARMTELLAVVPGDRVLEIGTGSGYQAAVLAKLGARVVSYERLPGLAESARRHLQAVGLDRSVEIRIGDGSAGDPQGAGYPGIVVTAGAPHVPHELLEQLADGGRLVIPVGPRDEQELIVMTRHGDEWDRRSDGACSFVPLVGRAGWPALDRAPDGPPDRPVGRPPDPNDGEPGR